MDNNGMAKQADLDYRVNKYTVKCLKITLVCLGLIWMANYLHIFIVNMRLL